ncbi:5053_t:CDS:2, partial [Racocetra fulgida]
MFETEIFEKQLERMEEGVDYEVLGGEGKKEGKKIYLVLSKRMIEVCWGEEFDDKFDYKVEFDEINDTFCSYKTSVFSQDERSGSDKDGNIIEEKKENLDEPFYLLTEENEEENFPKIIEISGNEIEARNNQEDLPDLTIVKGNWYHPRGNGILRDKEKYDEKDGKLITETEILRETKLAKEREQQIEVQNQDQEIQNQALVLQKKNSG